jgi:hypothetical protein
MTKKILILLLVDTIKNGADLGGENSTILKFQLAYQEKVVPPN